jgi:hypothetical protein
MTKRGYQIRGPHDVILGFNDGDDDDFFTYCLLFTTFFVIFLYLR